MLITQGEELNGEASGKYEILDSQVWNVTLYNPYPLYLPYPVSYVTMYIYIGISILILRFYSVFTLVSFDCQLHPSKCYTLPLRSPAQAPCFSIWSTSGSRPGGAVEGEQACDPANWGGGLWNLSGEHQLLLNNTNKQTDRQTNKQTDRQTNKLTK